MGSSRLGEMIQALEGSVISVFGQVMVDGTIEMSERLVIWGRAPDDLKVRVYDRVMPLFSMQFERHPLSQVMTLAEALPEPAGMTEYRAAVEAERARQEAEAQRDDLSEVERK